MNITNEADSKQTSVDRTNNITVRESDSRDQDTVYPQYLFSIILKMTRLYYRAIFSSESSM